MSYVERVARGIYWMLIGFGFAAIIHLALPAWKDSTDPENGRSGLRLFTDAGTGCQYLQGGLFGGMTPRFRADGSQFCGPAASVIPNKD